MSLYTAETRRLIKRRFTRFLALGTLLVLAAVVAGVFLSHHRPTPERLATAQAQADREYQSAVQQATRDAAECRAAQGTPAAQNYPPCDQISPPARSDFPPEWHLAPAFDFREQFRYLVITLAALLAVMAFVIGASFVGAEWSSGGMMNLLLWRPRRLEVLGTKLAALLVNLALFTVAVSAAWTGLFALTAGTRGTLARMTSGAWQSIVLMELRGLVLVLVAGALGFGLASLGRHTATALGAAIGVVIVLQVGLGIVLSMAGAPFVEAYLAPTWIQAWLDKSTVVTHWDSCYYSSVQGCAAETLTITWPVAGAAFAAVVVLVVGAAMWTMRSRDIT
ncbi:ABC transporter permease [Actinoplanes sp. ATCC 53533]|uniref:ABC transporter permease subunit n=1 Tax=Actinoplanes sp. ATCC 53533 TaxID=1288362 RepID=UPI000F79C09D|nr:ABC transporter permease subunit [Actinoplanes sp. ATCC 53533]RSM46598.1 ABC transporter permease [Actinoplanes sp. ATCC 53533]